MGAEGLRGIFAGQNTAVLFFFLILVIIFCNCRLFTDSDSLLFFFLLLVVLFTGGTLWGI
ncbi:hypothetical protein [Serpentinicella alkaliphila]|uniref:Uncharacterized protein n=1 Tax=Serpentinicella alkaliphila TaxID=1734049 RepID=A0A4R2TQ65_9FIRM|nr:hypothetical protein [Serpentinicella alkaliphila]QUH24837.1 hypothetical protein HZR23_02885 [Serpentinicella alkaliphila]TCQ03455.1 hypothetical protein EDD79_100935 [Serpentinicella alkaliphila]